MLRWKYTPCPSKGSLIALLLSLVLIETIVSTCASVSVFVEPVNSISPNPSAFRPKLPNDELELVRSHCPPEATDQPTSQPIVNIETN